MLGLAAVLAACAASSSTREAPEPTLAASRASQAEFRDLRRRFVTASPALRAELVPALERFLERHGGDPRGALARLYLAWIYAEQGKVVRARALVKELQVTAGSTRDLAVVVEAAIAEREGQAARALELLRPLSGKIVDPDERALYDVLYVRVALVAGRWQVAAEAMLDWLTQAPADERALVQQAVGNLLDKLPPAALEQALSATAGSSGPTRSAERGAAHDWLRNAIRERLARLALERRDAALARRLLDDAGARRAESDAALSKLAAGSTVLPRVAGRVVGLALSLGTAEAQRRSAQAAMGMTRALGLQLAAADDAVRLVIRDDAGDPATFERTLDELAGDGAVILVAGVDSQSAERAVAHADRAALPVVVLSPTGVAPRKSSFAFTLGADGAAELAALRAGLAARGKLAQALVGPGGAACSSEAPVAGETRFPVQKWKAERIDALLLLGDAACSREAVGELAALGVRPLLAFGFESAELFSALGDAQPMVSIASGSFPYRARSAPAEMRRWAETSGAGPRWYEALGRDAARLAAAALEGFPLERAEDAESVARLHRVARSRLLAATSDLWTSERRGFDGKQSLERRLDVVANTALAR